MSEPSVPPSRTHRDVSAHRDPDATDMTGEHRIGRGRGQPYGVFDVALLGAPIRLITHDGRELPAAATRWYAPADRDDDWLLRRCTGATLDLGCGPGRLVAELAARGTPALGIDCSPQAVRECRSRGGAALQRNLFATLPDEGRWQHVLLADGNIGIGGSPRTLLHRCRHLVRAGGTLLIETTPSGESGAAGGTVDQVSGRCWRGRARLQDPANRTPPSAWFAWAVVTTDALLALAIQLELTPVDVHHGRTRSFVELER